MVNCRTYYKKSIIYNNQPVFNIFTKLNGHLHIFGNIILLYAKYSILLI